LQYLLVKSDIPWAKRRQHAQSGEGSHCCFEMKQPLVEVGLPLDQED